jgi:murein DD-endopeptidase MepM/ murein hydrolase activator NlpD
MRPPMWAGTVVAATLLVASSRPPASFALTSRGVDVAVRERADERAELGSEGQRWLMSTRAALEEAREVQVPFADRVVVTDGGWATAAFAFKAHAGQILEATLLRELAAAADRRIYVELFRVVDVLGQPLHERLAAMRPSASNLRSRLPSDGVYHVLVQTDGAGAGQFRLTLELAAALPFPVVVGGGRKDAIRSLFGASRDDGKRHHEGIDIFVQRLTPVLAVAAGRVMPRQDALGGNTVWLNTPGTSYYYAHLDRVAVRDQQSVQVGDVLGYVGNSGNARSMASHLHFGVYRWGREPVDPLPLVVDQRFDKAESSQTTDAGG